MIKSITIKTIPHTEHRYPTVGDYWETAPGEWVMPVSDVGDWRMSMLVAFHELCELIQTEAEGISEESISDFDKAFEAYVATHPEMADEEPGEQTNAPYHKQHIFAESLERLLAHRLGINWKEYDEALMKVWRTHEQNPT